MCNWVSCWWEKVYDLSYLKRDFTNLRTWRLCQLWITSELVFVLSFFQPPYFMKFKWYISINTNMTYVNLINANLLKKRICRSMTGTIWKQKNTIWTTQVPILNCMDVHQSSIVLEFKFLNITAMKNLNSFSYSSILQLAFASSWNHSLRTSIHLSILDLKKSIHLLSPWQLKHPLCQTICVRPLLVEMLFIIFFYCLCKYAALGNHYLFYFHILYLAEKWGCKQAYWDTNSFLPAPFEPCEKKKYISVTSWSCVRNIHYMSSILVKIMNLIQFFFHMLTLKVLVQDNVTNHYGSDPNVSMNQVLLMSKNHSLYIKYFS